MKDDAKIMASLFHNSRIDTDRFLMTIKMDRLRAESILNGDEKLQPTEKFLIELVVENPRALKPAAKSNSYSVQKVPEKIDIDNEINIFLEKIKQALKDSGQSVEDFCSGNKNSNHHRRMVDQLFQSLHEDGAIGADAARVYQTSFWKAVKTDTRFLRSKFNKPHD